MKNTDRLQAARSSDERMAAFDVLPGDRSCSGFRPVQIFQSRIPLFFVRQRESWASCSCSISALDLPCPFKIVGAPWINASLFAEKLNGQKLPGVRFPAFLIFVPFGGLYKGSGLPGVLIQITDTKIYKPVAVQYLLLGMIKSLYPEEFLKRMNLSGSRKDLFLQSQWNGADLAYFDE